MKEIDPPREIFDALYPSAGAVVIHWAILEQSLEHWVAMIYRSPGGKLNERRIPYLYNPKITFLRNAFLTLPILETFKTEGLEVIGEIEKFSLIRATIVHGSISSYDPETKKLKFVRLPIDKEDDIHFLKAEYLRIQEITDAGTKILKLMTRALTFGHCLADALVR